jgi:hypothetical protein
MDASLFVAYNRDTGAFATSTNIEDEMVPSFIADFLHTQVGAGEDKSPDSGKKVCEIRIGLDMRDDTFTATDNIGNKSLRDGILLDVLSHLEKE